MKYYLIVFLLMSDLGWTPGWEVRGYSPREQPNQKVCIARAEKANKAKPPRGIQKWAWACVVR